MSTARSSFRGTLRASPEVDPAGLLLDEGELEVDRESQVSNGCDLSSARQNQPRIPGALIKQRTIIAHQALSIRRRSCIDPDAAMGRVTQTKDEAATTAKAAHSPCVRAMPHAVRRQSAPQLDEGERECDARSTATHTPTRDRMPTHDESQKRRFVRERAESCSCRIEMDAIPR